jgi:RNA polymerase sigma-B factor
MLAANTNQNESWITRYYYLCRRGARKFLRAGLERCDLEQVAVIGLLKAGRRYDAASKIPFEAYAWILILGELMHYARDYEHLVRIPRGVRKLERQYWEAFERLAAQFGREPSDIEIAAALGAPAALVNAAKLARWAASPASLENAAFREQEFNARFERDHSLMVTERIVLEEALAQLTPSERYILVSHYVSGQTQDAIAKQLGFSKRQVSRLQFRALERMRAHLAGAPV